MFEDAEESKSDENPELVFHYNRQKRLESAPKIVQDYYNGNMKFNKGFKVLVNKQNRYILFSLVVFVAACYGFFGIKKLGNYAKINEIDCEISSFSYEDQVYASIRFKRNVKSVKTEASMIKADFYIIDADKQLVAEETQNLIFTEGEQYLRTKCTDYDILKVEADVSVDGETKRISCNVKR